MGNWPARWFLFSHRKHRTHRIFTRAELAYPSGWWRAEGRQGRSTCFSVCSVYSVWDLNDCCEKIVCSLNSFFSHTESTEFHRILRGARLALPSGWLRTEGRQERSACLSVCSVYSVWDLNNCSEKIVCTLNSIFLTQKAQKTQNITRARLALPSGWKRAEGRQGRSACLLWILCILCET